MNFPQQVIEAFVYDQFDKYKVHEGSRGREVCFNGPWEPDTRFRMGINIHSNLVHDFNTGYSNNFIGFVADLLDLSYREAKEYIIKTYLNYKSIKEVIKPYKPEIKTVELAEMNRPVGLQRLNTATEYCKLAIKFLHRKHISPDAIVRFGLEYFETGYYAARLYIPFFMNSKLVFFQARDVLGEERWLTEHKRNKKYRKYLNPKGIQKSQIIYNYDSITEGSEICIVEGPLDAITLENGVAILGHTISRPQAKKIADKNPARVIFIPDNDAAGRDNLEKNIKIMREVAPEVDVGYYEIDNQYKDANEAQLSKIDSNSIKRKDKYSKIKEKLQTVSTNSDLTKDHHPSYNVLKRKLEKAHAQSG